jgi:hypothetical protein
LIGGGKAQALRLGGVFSFLDISFLFPYSIGGKMTIIREFGEGGKSEKIILFD